MKINIYGDFVSDESTKQLAVDDVIKGDLESGDVNILNFEAPVIDETYTPISKTGPNLKQHPDTIDWLMDNHFNLVSLANNHAFDYGEQGFEKTRSQLGHIKYVGGGKWDDAYRPLIIEKDGIKVGFIACTHFEFGTLTDKWDNRFQKGAAWINHPYIDILIVETKKLVDFLIILPHAGVEHLEQPLPEWRDRYYSFIDLGCDAVVASHPHIIQGIETYKNKPIFYSLGNFYFPQRFSNSKHWQYSIGISLLLQKNQDIEFETKILCFDKNEIKVCNNKDTFIYDYIKRTNITLLNKKDYLSYINAHSLNLLNMYYWMFRHGGLMKPASNWQDIKFCIKHKIGKTKSFIPSLINNLRCESHRFCITRALKLTNNIQ